MRTTHRDKFEAALRMAPLLRAITREMDERSERLTQLEKRLARLSRDHDRDEVRQIEAESAGHLRELRMAERELGRLGWSLDALEPLELSLAGQEGHGDVVWKPEDTGFYLIQPEQPE